MKKRRRPFLSLVRSFSIALGILMIWRGLWYLLDEMDRALFGGNHYVSVIGGIILGILILYLPDKDLDELGKL